MALLTSAIRVASGAMFCVPTILVTASSVSGVTKMVVLALAETVVAARTVAVPSDCRPSVSSVKSLAAPL